MNDTITKFIPTHCRVQHRNPAYGASKADCHIATLNAPHASSRNDSSEKVLTLAVDPTSKPDATLDFFELGKCCSPGRFTTPQTNRSLCPRLSGWESGEQHKQSLCLRNGFTPQFFRIKPNQGNRNQMHL